MLDSHAAMQASGNCHADVNNKTPAATTASDNLGRGIFLVGQLGIEEEFKTSAAYIRHRNWHRQHLLADSFLYSFHDLSAFGDQLEQQ